jgi:hypothetical protein
LPQYSARFNIAATVLADPADPDTYHPDRIADPALAALAVDGGYTA